VTHLLYEWFDKQCVSTWSSDLNRSRHCLHPNKMTPSFGFFWGGHLEAWMTSPSMFLACTPQFGHCRPSRLTHCCWWSIPSCSVGKILPHRPHWESYKRVIDKSKGKSMWPSIQYLSISQLYLPGPNRCTKHVGTFVCLTSSPVIQIDLLNTLHHQFSSIWTYQTLLTHIMRW
jgi:hypothetical protein